MTRYSAAFACAHPKYSLDKPRRIAAAALTYARAACARLPTPPPATLRARFVALLALADIRSAG